MKDKFLKRKYYECDCGSIDHILRVSYFSDDPYHLFFEVHLKQKSFLKRLWSAFLYVIGRRSRFGDFDEFLWSSDTVKDFNKFTEGFIEDQKKFFDKKGFNAKGTIAETQFVARALQIRIDDYKNNQKKKINYVNNKRV